MVKRTEFAQPRRPECTMIVGGGLNVQNVCNFVDTDRPDRANHVTASLKIVPESSLNRRIGRKFWI